MSNDAFHSSAHDTGCVGGAERPPAGVLCTRIMEGAFARRATACQ